MSSVLDRFLRYVTYDTQSDETSDTYPSTAKQLVLLRDLAAELQALGLADAAVDRYGYVTATVPATSSKPQTPVIGFIAHVDTSPEMSGAGVKPIVHRGYDGRDLVLPDDPSAVLRLADCPALAEQIGHDIVTASGTTLLGADNKAGVAEIVTAAAYLIAHPEIPHGPIRIAFTPDEEIGRGTKYFDVERFGARCAYTMDGGSRGEVETESFSADAITVTFHGFNTHPGYAKGRHDQRHQGGRRFHSSAAARHAVAGDDRRPRRVRAPLYREGRRRHHVGEADRPGFRDGGPEGQRTADRAPRPRGGSPISLERASISSSRNSIGTCRRSSIAIPKWPSTRAKR